MRTLTALTFTWLLLTAGETEGFLMRWFSSRRCCEGMQLALSQAYLEGDLVSVRDPKNNDRLRLCVVRSEGIAMPLCKREDDVETDLFEDPREFENDFWRNVEDSCVIACYGEGFYGQRPVPSLGGGPGYGAQANEIWSISEATLMQLSADEVEIPILDVGIAHGEKARGGFF